jgi:fatty-acyl-CoA synthase
MHTGDLATLDGDGYANIVGRIKDMVIRGGGERLST